MTVQEQEAERKTVRLKTRVSDVSKQKRAAPQHPRHTKELQRLKRIRGQVQGIENMILEGRYCPDILIQVKAATSALRALELSILESHIRHCLTKAAEGGSKREIETKIEEIIVILDRKGF